MDIPNLSTEPVVIQSQPKKFSLAIILIIIIFGIASGFGLSRFFPKTPNSNSASSPLADNKPQLSTDAISSPDQLKIGQLYGNLNQTFKDTATGVVEKGNINGVGTHILIRDGGPSQRASLTSSTVDLELFVGKKVEIKGETNASDKTPWLLDVGSIKILQ